jgi:LacI family transcriptional regulator
VPSGPTGRPATIYDVAAHAKLSIATVSRVLQGTGPVSEKARARVDQAARELNYVPLRAARSLAVQRHEAHGLVLPDLAGPFYGDLLMGYERWAGEHGQSVIMTVTHGNPDPERTVRDLAGRVDGIVVHGNALDLPTIQGLRKAGVPLVLIAHPPVTGCDSVRSESAASAEELTTRLLDHGRTNLLFVRRLRTLRRLRQVPRESRPAGAEARACSTHRGRRSRSCRKGAPGNGWEREDA